MCWLHGSSLLRNFALDKLYVICILLAVTEYEYNQSSKMNTKCREVERDLYPSEIGSQWTISIYQKLSLFPPLKIEKLFLML